MNPEQPQQPQPQQPPQPQPGQPDPQPQQPAAGQSSFTPPPQFNIPAQGPQPLNQQQPPEQIDVNYLDQIAPQKQVTLNRFAVFGLIGGVLMAALAAVLILVNSGGPNLNTQLLTIHSRVGTLQEVASEQRTHLNENQINQANATLESALTTMDTELTSILESKKISIKSGQAKNIDKKEETYASALKQKLDDSYQRGTLDRTYTTQMTYELTIFKNKLETLKRESKSESIDTFCTDAIANLDAILATYSDFTATK